MSRSGGLGVVTKTGTHGFGVVYRAVYKLLTLVWVGGWYEGAPVSNNEAFGERSGSVRYLEAFLGEVPSWYDKQPKATRLLQAPRPSSTLRVCVWMSTCTSTGLDLRAGRT